MSIARKYIEFFISFFAALIFLSFLSYIFKGHFLDFNKDVIDHVIYPIFFTLGFLFFALFMAAFRYLTYSSTLNQHSVLLSVHIDPFSLYERLWFYSIILLFYLVPIFRALTFNTYIFIRILLCLVSIGLLEVLFRLSSRSIKVYFLRQGILITGYDVRIQLPMLYERIHNDLSFYSYNDIESYLLYPDHVELFIISERGKLTFPSHNELNKQITGIMLQNKIEERKTQQ